MNPTIRSQMGMDLIRLAKQAKPFSRALAYIVGAAGAAIYGGLEDDLATHVKLWVDAKKAEIETDDRARAEAN